MAALAARSALWLLGFSLIIGQTLRLPIFGQAGGLLVSDIAVVVTLTATAWWFLPSLRSLEGPQKKVRIVARYTLLAIPFIAWSAFTLAVRAGEYDYHELIVAAAYWLRTSTYLMLLPAILSVINQPKFRSALERSFLSTLGILIGLGWLQRTLLPNVADLPALLLRASGGGWDPHEGRLIATWFDPNYFGAYVCLGLLYVIACIRTARFPGVAAISCLPLLAALLATESRSALLALVGCAVLLSPLIMLRLSAHGSPALLPGAIAAASLGLVLLAGAALMLGDRLIGAVTFDATVQRRLEASVDVWRLASQHPWTGVGYNAFQFAPAHTDSAASTLLLHSRAGADNSWLTLFTTTGLIGVLLFSLPWLVAAHQLLQQWLWGGQAYAVAALAGLVYLTIHAQFVNSWLYGHLLITISMLVALGLVPPSYEQVRRS